MSRITWNAVGERLFEAGVDHGVLYIKDSPGVPWNGLISIIESPSGGDVTPYYFDGIKYLDHAENESFEATLVAYMYPEEFAECDGTKQIGNGLSVTQQTKKPFNLSYRTKIGDDVKSTEKGYKIHLVYNVTARPSERSNNTMDDEIEPLNFAWDIFAVAPLHSGYKPTPHFVIDSRDTPTELLKELEDILYGTPSTNPRLPSVAELMFMFENYQSSIFDAGFLNEEYFNEFDAGVIPEPQTSTIDPGGP